MDIYERLRQEATAKRNAAYLKARNEYYASIRKIKDLKKRLGATVPVDRAPAHIVELIQTALPRHRSFTISEAIDWLRDAVPERLFFEGSVRVYFHELVKEGNLRRVRRIGRKVLWAFPEYVERESEFGAMRLPDIAETLLRERGPMTDDELLVVIRGFGYRADTHPRILLDSLQASLRRCTERFAQDSAGRWNTI